MTFLGNDNQSLERIARIMTQKLALTKNSYEVVYALLEGACNFYYEAGVSAALRENARFNISYVPMQCRKTGSDVIVLLSTTNGTLVRKQFFCVGCDCIHSVQQVKEKPFGPELRDVFQAAQSGQLGKRIEQRAKIRDSGDRTTPDDPRAIGDGTLSGNPGGDPERRAS